MGTYSYRSSSGCKNYTSSDHSDHEIDEDDIGSQVFSSRSVLRRRSPGSSFGYWEECDLNRGKPSSPHVKETRKQARRTYKPTRDTPLSKSRTTPITELTKFLHREWKHLKRGTWTHSRIMVFCSPIVFVFGSIAVLDTVQSRMDRRKVERRRAKEKEGENWSDGFQ